MCIISLLCLFLSMTLFARAQDSAQWVVPTTPLDSSMTDGNYFVGPKYHNAPELAAQQGVPHGVVKSFDMLSKDSKFYPGISKTQPGLVPYTRNVSVYVPAQYVPGTAAPLMVCQDASNVRELPTILDNMIADHRLPAMVVVFIKSGGGDGKGSERGLEYDTVSGKYAEFVEAEVLPRAARECNVKFSNDPDARATYGCSSGGAAALSMAWFHPDLYHRVLTYSGTYVNQQSPENPASPHGAWEYHEHLIPQSERKPIRIWLEVGENDNHPTDPQKTLHNWVLANLRMADVLKAKDYSYQFVYAKGARHVDQRTVRETLPHALQWLWQDYKSK